MKPAHTVSVRALGSKSKRQIENLLKRHYGAQAGQESVFRDAKPKMKAKDRRALQKGRSGTKTRQAQEEYNKNKRMNRENVRRRRSKFTAQRRGYAQKVQMDRR